MILGVFEGRVTALRTTSAEGAFSAPVVGGTYPVTIQARGFGAQTFLTLPEKTWSSATWTFSW